MFRFKKKKKKYSQYCCQNCGKQLEGYTIGWDYASFCDMDCMEMYLKSL